MSKDNLTEEEIATLKSKAHTVFTGTAEELTHHPLSGLSPDDRLVVVVIKVSEE